jgi:hypothetical protein
MLRPRTILHLLPILATVRLLSLAILVDSRAITPFSVFRRMPILLVVELLPQRKMVKLQLLLLLLLVDI